MYLDGFRKLDSMNAASMDYRQMAAMVSLYILTCMLFKIFFRVVQFSNQLLNLYINRMFVLLIAGVAVY